jgi:hypothetical protein
MEFNAKCAARRRGIVLVDALAYIALLGLVLILASEVFDKGMRQSTAFQRNVADIERALKAGERWRADVRAATGAIEVREGRMVIPQNSGPIVYEMGANQVTRLAGNHRAEIFLKGIKDAHVVMERRGRAIGWRWELELEHRRKEARVRPMFTFMAAAGGAR